MTTGALSELLTHPALSDTTCFRGAFLAGLRPDPAQTVDDWADQHVQLPSFVAESGRWRTDRTPFLREIMQCLSPSHPCEKVVFMKPVQIGGTQSGINWLGYIIDRAPGAVLIVEPTVDVAKKLSKQKVQPMLDLSPSLMGKVKESRSRDSGNTILSKEFLGGLAVFTGANSGIGLRFMSARYLLLDEVDAYPADVDGEGHPVDLAEKRTATFARRKIYLLSTPLEADTSRIEPEYEAGSRGRYHVPCPFCGHHQHLQWGQLVFTVDGVANPSQAAYRCAGCQCLIPEHYKTSMLARGRWVHEDPDHPVRTFHINNLYQPYGWPLSWSKLAEEWLAANEKVKSGDLRALKTFINTILAETWEEKGESLESSALYNRREVYDATCPAGVLVLTAAVDVQDNRLEVEIKGWGVGEECWAIAYRVFPGSPAQPTVWKDLTDWLQRKREHAYGGTLRVECVVVDTGGHHTKEAYWYIRRYRGRCYAIKGSNQQGAPLVPPRPTRPRGAMVHLYHVGTVAAKDTIFSRLALEIPGPGYMHFPLYEEANKPKFALPKIPAFGTSQVPTEELAKPFREAMLASLNPVIPHDQQLYDEEYFAQLAAEEKRNKYDRGVQTGYYYKKIRSRNEALDLTVYNLAAVALLNPHWEKLAEKIVPPPQAEIAVDEETGEALEPVGMAAPAAGPVAPPEKPTFVKKYAPPRRGGFTRGWR